MQISKKEYDELKNNSKEIERIKKEIKEFIFGTEFGFNCKIEKNQMPIMALVEVGKICGFKISINFTGQKGDDIKL